MSFLADDLRRWDGMGRPTPELDRNRSAAIRQAKILLERAKSEPSYVFKVGSELDKHSLYALVEIALSSAERSLASGLLANANWAHDEFGELADLRGAASLAETFERALKLQNRDEVIADISVNERLQAATEWLTLSIADRTTEACDEVVTDAELLRSVCALLNIRIELSPAVVLDEADFLFCQLDRQNLNHDRRDHFLGELALTAGVACRFLFRRNEAREWFRRAKSKFLLAERPAAKMARLEYQKLGLLIHERQFEIVLGAALRLAEEFRSLGLEDSATGCLFLEGCALRELGQLERSIEVHRRARDGAESTGNRRLISLALGNLAQLHRLSGNFEEALQCAQQAFPYLQEGLNRVNLAKLRWCVGDILREQGKRDEALFSYRSALHESQEIGIRLDEVEIRLVIADLLLDMGSDREAEQEVRAALPIIDEEQMVPEGMAALGLLRESLRRRQLDRGALRELHGYFPKG